MCAIGIFNSGPCNPYFPIADIVCVFALYVKSLVVNYVQAKCIVNALVGINIGTITCNTCFRVDPWLGFDTSAVCLRI